MQNLVRMANRIADFFEAMPERDETLQGIASHLKRFWEPRMRRQLLDHLDGAAGQGLKPEVIEALHAYRSELQIKD